MPSVNQELLDLAISHQVGLLRYGTSILRPLQKLLDESRAELQAVLEQRLKNILERGFDTGPVTTKRVAAQLKEVGRINAQIHAALGDELLEELKGLSDYETRFQERLLKGTLPLQVSTIRPGVEQLHKLITELPFEGRFYGEHISDVAAAQFKSIARRVQIGVVRGQTLDEIVRGVIGTKKFKYSDGVVSSRARRYQIETLVRTSVNHTATQSREALYLANQSLIKGVQIVATLDARTTLICTIEDGKIYPVGEGPRPPFHYSCRTTTAPVVKAIDEIGLKEGEISARGRASMDGTVSAKLDYEKWIRRQPDAVMNAVFGVSRAKVLRANPKVGLDVLADAVGRPLPLRELAVREAQLFAKLSPGDLAFIRRMVPDLEERLARGKVKLAGKKKQATLPPPEPPPPDPSKLLTDRLEAARQWARENGAPVLAETNEELADEMARKVNAWIRLQHRTGQMSDDLWRGHLREFDADRVAANWLRNLKGSTVGAADAELRLVIQQAINDNWRNPVFRALMDSDLMPEERLVGLSKHLKSSAWSGDLAAASRNAHTTMFWDARLAGWADELQDIAPGRATAQSWGGPAATVRHEQAHSIWRVLDDDIRRRFDDTFHAQGTAGVKRDVTLYSKTNSEELFAEVFAVVTDPRYRRTDWKPWVNELGDDLKDALAKTFKVDRAALEPDGVWPLTLDVDALATKAVQKARTATFEPDEIAGRARPDLGALNTFLDAADYNDFERAARARYADKLREEIDAGRPLATAQKSAQEALEEYLDTRGTALVGDRLEAALWESAQKRLQFQPPSGTLAEFVTDDVLTSARAALRQEINQRLDDFALGARRLDAEAIVSIQSTAGKNVMNDIIKRAGALSDQVEDLSEKLTLIARDEVRDALKFSQGRNATPFPPGILESMEAEVRNAVRSAVLSGEKVGTHGPAVRRIVDKVRKAAETRTRAVWDEALASIEKVVKEVPFPADPEDYQRFLAKYFEGDRRLKESNIPWAYGNKDDLLTRLTAPRDQLAKALKNLDDDALRNYALRAGIKNAELAASRDELIDILTPFNEAQFLKMQGRLESLKKTGKSAADVRLRLLDEDRKLEPKRKEAAARREQLKQEIEEAQRPFEDKIMALRQEIDDLPKPDLMRALFGETPTPQELAQEVARSEKIAEIRKRIVALQKERRMAIGSRYDEMAEIDLALSKMERQVANSVRSDVGGAGHKLSLTRRPSWKKGDKRHQALADALDWIGDVWHPGFTDKLRVLSTRNRAHYKPLRYERFDDKAGAIFATPHSGQGTFIHEIAHWIEDRDPDLHEKIVGFFKRRIDRAPDDKWIRGPQEWGYSDDFINEYMGRVYHDAGDQFIATEILSMGLELLYSNPVGLARRDPEYFDFIIDLLLGNL